MNPPHLPVVRYRAAWARWCRAEAQERLKQEGVAARLVSRPSWELFEQQDEAYRDSVLSPT